MAAPLGSIAGAAACLPFYAPPSAAPGQLLAITCVLALVGLVVSLPSLLLIGIPMSWPFRQSIYRHPVASALLYGLIGAFAGVWVTVIIGAAGSATLLPAIFIGAGTAVA